jgi:hypothetical protein
MTATHWIGVLALAGVLAGSRFTGIAQRVDASAAAPKAVGGPSPSGVSEHRYRIIGKVRMLLFWISSDDDVGGARVAWQHDGSDCATISLLIGSDPARAPRRINEWGYIRERVCGDSSDVFGVRTMSDADSVEDAVARTAQMPGASLFGAMCSTTTLRETTAAASTLRLPHDITYYRFDRLLNAMETASRWEQRRALRPPGAVAGFLTALDRQIRANATVSPAPNRVGSPVLSYLYRGTLYDLRLQHSERIARTRIGSIVYRDVVRTEFSVSHRGTGNMERFVVTYPVEGPLANVPIRATYQPNHWFKIELQLDDALQLPEDPGRADGVATRIDQICARQTALGAVRPTLRRR